MERGEMEKFLHQCITGGFDKARFYAYSNSNKLPYRFAFYNLKKRVEDYLAGKSEDRLILLPGLRGVGKTTLLSQFYLYLTEELGIEKERVIFVSVDELVKTTGLDISSLVKSYEANYLGKYLESLDKNVFFLLDEVHYDKDWAINLKILYDRSKKVFTVATGSSALSLTSSLDLARRASFEELFPLNFSEYLLLKGKYSPPENLRELTINLIFNPKLVNEFKKEEVWNEFLKYRISFTPFELENFLKLFGFPFSIFNEEREICDKIQKILDRIVYEDLRKVENFDLSTLEKSFKVIFLLASFPGISFESISKEVGMSKETVSRILKAFEKCMLITSVKPYGKEEKVVKKAWRYYFASPTIRYCIKKFLGAYREEDRGILLEDYVASVLVRMKRRVNFDIFFDSKKGGSNFLIKRFNEKPIPLEIKFGEKGEKQIYNSMKRFNSPYGIIISEAELEFNGKILYLPKELFFII